MAFDRILSGGTVIDGTGDPPLRADVGIDGDRIAAIGDLAGAHASLRMDVTGKVVAPGFIDTHTHDDTALMLWPDMPMKVSQGVTTVVIGNCGISLAPSMLSGPPPPPLDLIGDLSTYRFRRMGDYLNALDAEPAAVNVVSLVGHTVLRASVMRELGRAADPTEIREMSRMLDEALDSGSVGLSTGLFYKPARAAPADEIIALARIVANHGGLHSTHMRDEADEVETALREAFSIGRSAGVPTLISHHKVMGLRNHGRTVDTLRIIDEARRQQPIAIDAYPYVASSTILAAERARQSSSVLIAWSIPRPDAAGRYLAELSHELGLSEDETIEALSPAGGIYFVMDEEDVRRVLAWPETMIGSDGIPQDEFPHPRLWGTFPRVLGYYSREVRLFTLEQAVRKMTALPADAFGLRDRGLVKPGYFADLTVFDPDDILDRATFAQPKQSSAGVELVFVNGSLVWQNYASTGSRPGRVLRRQGLDAPMALRRPPHLGTDP